MVYLWYVVDCLRYAGDSGYSGTLRFSGFSVWRPSGHGVPCPYYFGYGDRLLMGDKKG